MIGLAGDCLLIPTSLTHPLISGSPLASEDAGAKLSLGWAGVEISCQEISRQGIAKGGDIIIKFGLPFDLLKLFAVVVSVNA